MFLLSTQRDHAYPHAKTKPATRKRPLIKFLSACALLAFMAPDLAHAQMGPLPVDVAKPLQKRIVDWDEYTGRFEAVQRVDVRPRVSGFLEEIHFTDGQLVEKGDLLFTIDPRPFQASLDQANAELNAAEAEQARALLDLERAEELVDNRTFAQSTLDDRRADKLRADAQVAIAEAAVRAAQLNVDYTRVTAPFSGRISDNKVDVGALLTENQTNMATVLTIDPIHLVFTGSESDFLKYSRLSQSGSRGSSRDTANPVEARLIDESGWPHKGTMNFVDNELDQNSGTIRARAVFENSDDFLTPGLFARLRIIGSGEYDALLLPDAAILSDQSRRIVMVVDGEGNVAAKAVEVGPLYEGMRVIRSGLEAEDLVVVTGVQRARPGGQVTPTEVTLPLGDGS